MEDENTAVRSVVIFHSSMYISKYSDKGAHVNKLTRQPHMPLCYLRWKAPTVNMKLYFDTGNKGQIGV